MTELRVEGGERHRQHPIQWVLRLRGNTGFPALHSPYLLGVSPAKLLKLLPKAWVWVGDGPGGLDGFKHFPPA